MARYLRVTMSDGSRWDIPALYIARDRASYYAEYDTGATSGEEYDKVYQDEYTYTMGAADELLDYASNNIDWKDVEQYAVRVQEPVKIDMAKEWTNADKEIIDRE